MVSSFQLLDQKHFVSEITFGPWSLLIVRGLDHVSFHSRHDLLDFKPVSEAASANAVVKGTVLTDAVTSYGIRRCSEAMQDITFRGASIRSRPRPTCADLPEPNRSRGQSTQYLCQKLASSSVYRHNNPDQRI